MQKNKVINLKVIRNRLEIRKHLIKKDVPLDEQETMVSKAIYQQLITRSGLPAPEAEKQLQLCIGSYGGKALINLFIEPTLVMGIPAMWFIGIYVSCFLAFLLSHNLIFLLINFALHIALYFYYRRNRLRLRQERINRILTEGI